MSATHAIANLRHLYAQMIEGHVRDTGAAARGLLGPAIEELERFMGNRLYLPEFTGQGFCDCGMVEFLVPSVPRVRVVSGDSVVEHSPIACVDVATRQPFERGACAPVCRCGNTSDADHTGDDPDYGF